MRTVQPGAGSETAAVWPETLEIGTPFPGAIGDRELAAAAAGRQRLTLMAPVRLGVDPIGDAAVLTFLSVAATWMVPVDWTLTGTPPWPTRSLVHLPPPARAADPAAERYRSQWHGRHRFGLCTYRRGPGFARILDVRPDGPHQRLLIDDPWTVAFDALLADSASPAGGPAAGLLDELVEAGLALRLGEDRHHLLPVRRRRAPVPLAEV